MEKMTIKDFLKLYVSQTDVMYESQYIHPNGRLLRVENYCSFDESTDYPILPYSGEVVENHFYSVVFYDDKYDYPQVVAMVTEKPYSEYDYFDDWCNQELEV